MSGHQIKIFKLIVQPSINCMELLRYLNKNIEEVNVLGVGIKIEKISGEIDDDTAEVFRQKGITRLPALIAPEGKVFIGLQQVIGLFEKNLTRVKNMARASGYGTAEIDSPEYGGGTDVASYMQREIFAGVERDGKGRLIQQKDKDMTPDESDDFQKKMSAFNRVTKHRRQTDDEQDLDDPMPRTRRTSTPVQDDEDNIADDEPAPKNNIRAPRQTSSGDGRADDMDKRMMDAWLDNNPVES